MRKASPSEELFTFLEDDDDADSELMTAIKELKPAKALTLFNQGKRAATQVEYEQMINLVLENGYDELLTQLLATPFKKESNLNEDLYSAIRSRKNPDEVKKLLEAKADVNYRKNGETLLTLAARSASPGVVAELVKSRANVNATNDRGDNPAMVATMAENDPVLKFLLTSQEVPEIKLSHRNLEDNDIFAIAIEADDFENFNTIYAYQQRLSSQKPLLLADKDIEKLLAAKKIGAFMARKLSQNFPFIFSSQVLQKLITLGLPKKLPSLRELPELEKAPLDFELYNAFTSGNFELAQQKMAASAPLTSAQKEQLATLALAINPQLVELLTGDQKDAKKGPGPVVDKPKSKRPSLSDAGGMLLLGESFHSLSSSVMGSSLSPATSLSDEVSSSSSSSSMGPVIPPSSGTAPGMG